MPTPQTVDPAVRLDEIEARANAATDGPWENVRTSYGPTVEHDDEMVFVQSYGVTWTPNADDAEFIAHARTDVPWLIDLARRQDAALRAVLKPEMVQRPDWLGDKATFDGEDAEEPGNDAYLDYLERVLTAAGYTDIPWGPVFVAITLDRLVRANEDHAAITSALGGAR